jgi:hypothetical protein
MERWLGIGSRLSSNLSGLSREPCRPHSGNRQPEQCGESRMGPVSSLCASFHVYYCTANRSAAAWDGVTQSPEPEGVGNCIRQSIYDANRLSL